MKVLVACEFSGVVRDAFMARGHNAWSCDLLPTERPGQHLEMSVLHVLEHDPDWDLMIGHPPCTRICNSSSRWWKANKKQQEDAVEFFLRLANADVPRIAIENPIGIMSTRFRKPDQIIQPWQFGHGETKATCLWLKNLPPLKPTNIVSGREPRIHWMAPSKRRSMERSRTYQGIAGAMAEQWGTL